MSTHQYVSDTPGAGGAGASGPDVSLWPFVKVNTSNQAVGTSAATFICTNVVKDKTLSGAYSTSTGKFTVPVGQAGAYEIAVVMNSQGQVSSSSIAGGLLTYLRQNSNAQADTIPAMQFPGAVSTYIGVNGVMKVWAEAGDELSVEIFHAGNVVAYNLEPGAIYNSICFSRVG